VVLCLYIFMYLIQLPADQPRGVLIGVGQGVIKLTSTVQRPALYLCVQAKLSVCGSATGKR
jgi:hypothetical protein